MAEAEETDTLGTGQPVASDKNTETVQIVKPSKVGEFSDTATALRDGEC